MYNRIKCEAISLLVLLCVGYIALILFARCGLENGKNSWWT